MVSKTGGRRNALNGHEDARRGECVDSKKGPNAGALWLFTDPAPGTYVFSDGDAVFTAEGPSDNLGAGVAVGDVDGDRIAEIIIGAPYQDSGGSTAGAFYVMHAL